MYKVWEKSYMIITNYNNYRAFWSITFLMSYLLLSLLIITDILIVLMKHYYNIFTTVNLQAFICIFPIDKVESGICCCNDVTSVSSIFSKVTLIRIIISCYICILWTIIKGYYDVNKIGFILWVFTFLCMVSNTSFQIFVLPVIKKQK